MLAGCKFDALNDGADGDDNTIAAGDAIANIKAIADTASVDVEIYVMSA